MEKALVEFKVSYVGEDDARVYLVSQETYDEVRRIFDTDVDFITFKPHGFIREVSVGKRQIKRVMW